MNAINGGKEGEGKGREEREIRGKKKIVKQRKIDTDGYELG